jgi:hypothetical protein
MSFEDKEAELGVLLSRMQNEPENWHELCKRLHGGSVVMILARHAHGSRRP